MNKLLRLKKVIASLLVAGVVVPAAFQAATAHAQDAQGNETRFTNLIIEAHAARDKGDYALAKAKAEEALKIDPNSDFAKSLIAQIDQASSTPATTAVEPATPPPPATALDRVAQKNDALYGEVQNAMIEAVRLAQSGQAAEALVLLDKASHALPDNVGSQALKARLSLVRQDIESRRTTGGYTGLEQSANQAIAATVAANRRAAAEAVKLADEARGQIKRDQLDAAQASLDKAVAILPPNIAHEKDAREIRKVQSLLLRAHMEKAIQARDLGTAERYLNDYGNLNGQNDKGYLQLKEEFAVIKDDPSYRAISGTSPNFARTEERVKQLLITARSQYLYGDYVGAQSTYKDALLYQPYNTEAKYYLIRINEVLSKSGALNRPAVKSELLNLVDEQWNLPGVFNKEGGKTVDPGEDPLLVRLKNTVIPTITLRDAPLAKAIETLAELSVVYDREQKGINMVTIDPEHKNPAVTITMRNMSLDRILEFVVKSVNFNYSINNGVVEVRPDIGSGETETEFFPVSHAAVLKMTGIGAGGASSSASSGGSGGGFMSSSGGGAVIGAARPEEDAIKAFLQRSGVPFEGVAGSTLSYDGANIIVTQSRRNLDRIKNILRRYSNIKQVTIESKFLEVTEGVLKQLSTNWVVQKDTANGTVIRARTNLRTLGDTYGASLVSTPGTIVTTPSASGDVTGGVLGETITREIPNTPPAFPQTNTGPSDPTFDGVVGSIGSWDLRLMVDAIEQNQGSDLMAAPSLTVLDGKTATIRIAQMLRYPESYGDIQSNVGSSSGGYNSSSGTGASVTITAGTPQDFTTQDVGVKLEVTPSVSEDDTISLTLKPQVIEFEGFVEYGGTSVAIAGNTTVTVPSGFFQPVFSIREVVTDVAIFDGATVVIGGLTREEMKTVDDKIPVLGDIPILGAAFRSKGKSSSKRNLMVFVTANLISPGGGPIKQSVGTVRPGTTFASPVLLTPSGGERRDVIERSTTSAAPTAPAAQ